MNLGLSAVFFLHNACEFGDHGTWHEITLLLRSNPRLRESRQAELLIKSFKVKFYKDLVHMLHGRFTLGEWPILLS